MLDVYQPSVNVDQSLIHWIPFIAVDLVRASKIKSKASLQTDFANKSPLPIVFYVAIEIRINE